jgi:putative YphP/YqiW family bacilliredoxin
MPYPEPFIAPMRAELTRAGVRELRTADAVDEVVRTPGTVMIVVNSICGCAAGKARPGIVQALQHEHVPDVVATVFAGADEEATARAREYFAPYPPSSPSVGILRDGKLVFMLQRRDIETRNADLIANELTTAFDRVCAPTTESPA